MFHFKDTFICVSDTILPNFLPHFLPPGVTKNYSEKTMKGKMVILIQVAYIMTNSKKVLLMKK